ncbi:hypothetical protein [Actinomadura madurae]|uniref:hypothetical protein n=1 Tax=Actinomadura madurae TaxID=1993 RepID=UPI0020262697|nr:hypothetical protein [Actinomadura madurae]MCP9955113.1 hypothetical protein [Actinomadura madurae]MCP9971842.1 hypothetical protein [Actinomadura madurae]MCP9984350.1 hypothetical protein [Actinomadura madurae]MCQ0020544.1 hypothetical protein [Actinomadura madurae]URN02746.1 hypothetical protein LUW74_04805 [Actinomadura madurae]
MRLSSSLPPAGFTRAEPRPPARRPPRAAVVAVALVLGAGLFLAVGHGTARTVPARTVTPDAATPAASARPSPARPSPASSRTGRTAAEPHARSSAHRPRVPRRAPRRTHAAPSPREKGRPADRPRPAKTRTPRAVRPAAPSWIAAECRRRYPADPFRRSACVAALTEAFGG